MNNTKSNLTRVQNNYAKSYTSVTSTSSSTTSSKYGKKNTMISTSEIVNKNGEVLYSGKTTSSSRTFNADYGIISGAFGALFSLLIIINLINLTMGHNDYHGFEWLLHVLSDAPSISLDWLTEWSSYTVNIDALDSSWRWFGELVSFFNDAFKLIAFVSVGSINILLFIFYFIKEFFLSAV